MSKYVDVYVLPVPKAKIEAYRKMARQAGEVWKEFGALEYIEVVADDVKPGKHTSFPQAVDLQEDETTVVGWIVFASRAERDRINAIVMKDPRVCGVGRDDIPFDARRMFWGGFAPLVDI